MSYLKGLTPNEKRGKHSRLTRYLAEIDYMLFVIEKDGVSEAKEFYRKHTLSEVEVMLVKRLNDFAEAETYRDYDVSKREEYKYRYQSLKKIAS